MTIPLNRLYDYIERLAQQIYVHPVLIYRFWPHGSKNLKDLVTFRDYPGDNFTSVDLYCHDQEPLCYDHYEDQCKKYPLNRFATVRNMIIGDSSRLHPNLRIGFNGGTHYNNLALLLHSEKNSPEVDNYEKNDFIMVYYWSHAVIARDWFRYAQHLDLKKNNKLKYKFLIYNRAWSGTREYRLKFADMLIESKLHTHCKTTCNAIDSELNLHYTKYEFKNPKWKPMLAIENYFKPTCISSNASADFDIDDYEQSDIEVVLETLFDDKRLHLTEKSLRPIALGQPFLLVATAGSLEYLRSYGFKTYSDIWDESYDQVQDAHERLKKVVQVMESIVHWTPEIADENLARAGAIAEYNKKHFFSNTFSDQITQELETNLISAFKTFDEMNCHSRWIKRWTQHLQSPDLCDFLKNDDDDMTPDLDVARNALIQLSKLDDSKNYDTKILYK